MHEPPVCRAARIADLAALFELESQFPGDRLSRRQLRHHLASSSAQFRVLQGSRGPLGYSLLLHRRGSAMWRLYSIVVDVGSRGRGFGRMLLTDAERGAAAAGAVALRLEVRADNAAAIDFYHRAGYSQRGRKLGYYDDGVDGLLLQRTL